MAAPDSHSQCFLFEGPQQPAVQLMAPQTLLHWPGTGSFGEASAPAALAPARLQQVQHAQHMPPLGQQSMHGGQYDAAYPLPAQGVHPQAPSQQLQALPAQLHHAPQLLALQPQQGSAAGAIYVNQRQLASILRRRAKRQKQEAENKLPRVRQSFVNRAAHQHAKSRPRDARGKFLSKEEIEAQERLESGLADLVDARLEQEAPLQQLQQERQPSDGGVDNAPLPALAGARPCTLSACGVRRTRS